MSLVQPPDPFAGQQPQSTAPTTPMQTGQAYAEAPPLPVGYAPPPPPRKTPMSPKNRLLITWAVIGVMLLVTALAAIGALNRDVYGAGAFVGRYLDALASKDAAAALETPGVALDPSELGAAGLPEGSSDLLLRNEALSGLGNVQQLADDDLGDGVHEVRFSYEAAGSYGESTFYVKSDGVRFPLIPQWRFDESPLAVVNLAVQHTTSFSANGFDIDTRQATAADQAPAFDNIVNLLVFSPGQYDFRIDTGLLRSEPEDVLIDEPSRVHEAAVEALPTDELVELVQQSVNDHLDECTTQAVLQPTGCPFGINIDDRVSSPPVWSMDSYPEVVLEPGDEAWEIPLASGDATIDVDIQSLFDGSVSSVDEDVPFSMTGLVYVQGDGSVDVQLEAVDQE